ncbi:MAG TPA: TylF/MycF family methyltransferase [Actinomycetes bacterium]|jgi:O-methyltransferase|nr:TylF/MycF family methyltransferase [Actinomycetes bacterium]
MEAQQRTAAELYLDLLKKCLTRYLFGEGHVPVVPQRGTLKHLLFRPVRSWLAGKDMEVVRHVPFDPQTRAEGRDWPAEAESMAGLRRLDNLQDLVTDVLRRGVPGDLIETGAWRGGATILMRAVLEAYGDPDRRVWVADSFQGLPRPDPGRWPAEAGDEHWTREQLAVPLEQVQANFARYGLLDDRVRFLAGWFKDTLPDAPIERLAVLRLDGDMYGSTMEALEALYPKLSVGGYVIVDDYGAIPQCKEAVTDFRTAHGITDPMEWVDWTGVWWQRSAAGP